MFANIQPKLLTDFITERYVKCRRFDFYFNARGFKYAMSLDMVHLHVEII